MVLTEYWTDSPEMFSLEAWLLPLEMYEICCLLKMFSIEYPVLSTGLLTTNIYQPFLWYALDSTAILDSSVIAFSLQLRNLVVTEKPLPFWAIH